MQCTRGSDENSLCPSVCLSALTVKCVDCDKTEERSVQICRPFERAYSLLRKKWLVGRPLLYLKFWVNQPPLERNRRFSTDIRPYLLRRNTYSEKRSINTNRKTTTRFPMSLRWSSYVAPKSPKGVSKTQNDRFP